MKYILHKNVINLNNIELSENSNHNHNHKKKIIYHLNNIKLNGLSFKINYSFYNKKDGFYYFYIINNNDLLFLKSIDDFLFNKLNNYKSFIIKNNILKIKIINKNYINHLNKNIYISLYYINNKNFNNNYILNIYG